VVALPHIGSATHDTRYAMAEMAASNLLQVLAGEQPAGRFDLSQV
jgi:lactate dehydrogenase-like 2-hydroxyacid dehydrogenase